MPMRVCSSQSNKGVMRRFLLLITLLAAGFMFDTGRRSVSADSQSAPARRALLIGVGKYESNQFPSLDYPKNDVARFGELLESPPYGFTVTRLTDESPQKPTRTNILNAIQRVLIDESHEGDTVIFYFSGHGSWVTNSLSDESDLRDETLVPADAVRPVKSSTDLRDIRDKEVAELFNRALDKKIKLTAIIDSCHSGSIARGDEQTKEVDGVAFDIKTRPSETQRIKPEDRGALIITAAEDYQQASGSTYELNGITARYSHLTAEILRSLYEVPADRQTTRDLFRRVSSRLVAAGRSQTPTIAGDSTRFDETLFGKFVRSDERARASLTVVEKDGERKLVLAAGIADGLEAGVVMRRVDRNTLKDTDPGIRIRLKSAGLSISELDVLDAKGRPVSPADPDAIKTDDYFEQMTWAVKREPDLSVWIPPAWLTESQLKAAAADLRRQLSGLAFESASEPAAVEGQNIIFAEPVNGKTEWKLRNDQGSISPLGPKLNAAQLTRVLTRPNGTTSKVFVDLPPSLELRSALTAVLSAGGKTMVASTPANAQYQLAGRLGPTDALEYCWVLRAAMQPKVLTAGSDARVSLPPITNWVYGGTTSEAAAGLSQLSAKLSKIRGWLNLTSPIAPGSPEFPYRLEIRSRKGAGPRSLEPGDTMYADREYDIVLMAPRKSLENNTRLLREFWVYVLEIDSSGTGKYLDSTGSSERYGGMRNFDPQNPPDEIRLVPSNGAPLTVGDPYGTETFILLVTDHPISRTMLDFAGVRGQDVSSRGNESDLENLLSGIGVDTATRGRLLSPETWAVQKLVLRSVGSSR